MNRLGALDYIVMGGYLLGTAAIAIRTAGRQTTTREYFTANRQIPGWAVGFAMMATTVSSPTFVAIPGSTFARDWWQMLYMLMALGVLTVLVPFVVPLYRRAVKMSAYEYLEERFGYGARLYGAAGFTLLRIADLGFTLYLTGVAVEVVTGWDIGTVVMGVGAFTLVYTLIGGIEGAIWTSVVQGGILVGSAGIILFAIFFGSEAGPATLVAHAYQNGKLSLGDFDLGWGTLYREQATGWILMIAGLLHFSRYYVTEQSIIQRYLVARSDQEARSGVRLGVLITVPTWLTFAFIGTCLWSYYDLAGTTLPPQVLSQPDNIVPHFIATQLPTGVVGLILAGLLAAAMSSVSADLNSVATVLTQDFFVRAFPRTSDRKQLFFGRLAVLIGGVWCTGAALLLTLTRSTAAYEVIVISVSIVAGGMLGLFGLGFLSRRANRAGANVGIIVCLLFVGWATLTGPLGVDLGYNFRMNTLLIGVFSHFILFGAGYLASRFLGGQTPDVERLTVWALKGTGVREDEDAGEPPRAVSTGS
jgi:SSS family solute:Na+ symporter